MSFFLDQFIFHPSGGLIYHARALRYAKTYWKNHRVRVQNFLNHWNPKGESILLVGPSAGYSLPKEWLGRFKKVFAFEPDPIARAIFEKRFKIKPHWMCSPVDLEQKHSESEAVLFCNVLGQLEITNSSVFTTQFLRFCEGKSWASFHDVFSGADIRWNLNSNLEQTKKLSLNQIKSGINLAHGSSQIVLNAHSAYELFPASDSYHFEYWEWRLTPNQTHVIEGVFLNTSL